MEYSRAGAATVDVEADHYPSLPSMREQGNTGVGRDGRSILAKSE